MSAPIVPDTLVFILNTSNSFQINKILNPPIQNKNRVRVICSTANVVLQISCLRSSFILSQNSPDLTSIDGICIPDSDIWYDTNSLYINNIKCSIFQEGAFQYDNYSVTLQFAE